MRPWFFAAGAEYPSPLCDQRNNDINCASVIITNLATIMEGDMFPAYTFSNSSVSFPDVVGLTRTSIQDYHTEMEQYRVLRHKSEAVKNRARALRAHAEAVLAQSRRLRETYLNLQVELACLSTLVETSPKDFENCMPYRCDTPA